DELAKERDVLVVDVRDLLLAEDTELLLLLLLPALVVLLSVGLPLRFRHLDRRLLLRAARPDRHGALPVAAAEPASLLLDLGGGPLQAGPDFLRLDLDRGPLLALLGLPAVRPEPPDDDDARALGERLGDVLSERPPRRDVEEVRLDVLPLA